MGRLQRSLFPSRHPKSSLSSSYRRAVPSSPDREQHGHARPSVPPAHSKDGRQHRIWRRASRLCLDLGPAQAQRMIPEFRAPVEGPQVPGRQPHKRHCRSDDSPSPCSDGLPARSSPPQPEGCRSACIRGTAKRGRQDSAWHAKDPRTCADRSCSAGFDGSSHWPHDHIRQPQWSKRSILPTEPSFDFQSTISPMPLGRWSVFFPLPAVPLEDGRG